MRNVPFTPNGHTDAFTHRIPADIFSGNNGTGAMHRTHGGERQALASGGDAGQLPDPLGDERPKFPQQDRHRRLLADGCPVILLSRCAHQIVR